LTVARILIATIPIAGHIAPFIPVAKALLARGHEVWWYTGRKFQAKVENAGAVPRCFSKATDYDDADFESSFPGRDALTGLSQLRFDMKHVFIDCAPGQAADLEHLVNEFQPDVLLVDPGMLGGGIVSAKLGVKLAVLGVLPLPATSVDVAPFGLGLAPSASPLGKLRNRALNALVQAGLFRDVQRQWNKMRLSVGLAETEWWMDSAFAQAEHYFHPSIPSFEYPRSDLSKNVQFVGALDVEPAFTPETPDFWHELSSGLPVIHVTQGTLANLNPVLFKPAIEGLAKSNALVVVSTGGRSFESLQLGSLPSNVRLARFLDYRTFLPKVSIIVTNGGYGGVQLALKHGIPLVVAGASEDKPEVAARVAWSGTGVNLKTATPTPHQVRQAVERIQNEPRFRERAQELSREYASYQGALRVVDTLERTSQRRSMAAE
jgi:MGT family glycosyltransferase